MRIGLDGRPIYPGMGGIGYYTRNLVRSLAQIDHDNEYRVLNFHMPQSEIVPDAPPNFHFYNGGRLHRKAFNFLTERLGWPPVQLYLGPLDLVHFPWFGRFPCGDTPFVLTMHDLIFVRFPQFVSQHNLGLARANAQAMCVQARHIMADSQTTKDDLIELFGTPEDKVTVVYLATEAFDWPQPTPEQLAAWRRKWGLRKSRFLLFVGTIEPRKNIPFLLEAFARFPHRADFELVLVGQKGWYYDKVFETIKALKLEDDVRHVGYVPDDELAGLYAEATLFVLPSFYEGFGIPPLDAMARGVPTLVANNSSLREVVGDAGKRFELDDPDRLSALMAEIVADSGRLAAMRERGYEQARRFTWRRTAEEARAVYERALATARP